jgi:hypothetical protein
VHKVKEQVLYFEPQEVTQTPPPACRQESVNYVLIIVKKIFFIQLRNVYILRYKGLAVSM